MKDSNDEVFIPVKLSHHQIMMLAFDVAEYYQDNPELRLGQAFCNMYRQKFSDGLHYPELYYTESGDISELTEAFLLPESERGGINRRECSPNTLSDKRRATRRRLSLLR